MKKQYNNLDITNLIKTEWFNQFNKEQQEEIIKGLQDSLDVSIYAKKEFDCFQMQQIRAGLFSNVDISKYANPEISWQEMEQIRKNLMEEKTR